MKFSVELTEDDHVQMQIDHTSRSKTTKFIKRALFILGIFCFPLLILFIATSENGSDIGLVGVLLSIGFVGLFSPILIPLLTKAVAKSFVSEGSIESQIGLTTYDLNEETISRRSNMRYEELDWRLIQKIVEGKNHIYIYDSSVSAFIIPKRDLDDQEIKDMIRITKSKIRKKDIA